MLRSQDGVVMVVVDTADADVVVVVVVVEALHTAVAVVCVVADAAALALVDGDELPSLLCFGLLWPRPRQRF